MPLANVATLKKELLKVMKDGVDSEPDAVKAWGDAISKYYGTAIIPPGAVVAKSQIEAAVTAALQGMSKPGAGIVAIPNAFLAGAVALAASPANAPGVTVPPPGPPPIVLGAPMSAEAAASMISATVAVWVIGGTYTVPLSPPVPWS